MVSRMGLEVNLEGDVNNLTHLAINSESAGLVGEQEGDNELDQDEAHTSSADCDEEEDSECDSELDKSEVGSVESAFTNVESEDDYNLEDNCMYVPNSLSDTEELVCVGEEEGNEMVDVADNQPDCDKTEIILSEECDVNMAMEDLKFVNYNNYDIEVLRASNSKLQEELWFQKSRYDGCHQKMMQYEVFHAKAKSFGSSFICDNDRKTQFYTGLPSHAVFKTLFEILKSSPTNDKNVSKACSLMDEFFITLVKLQLGLLHQDIAYRSNILNSDVSTIFH